MRMRPGPLRHRRTRAERVEAQDRIAWTQPKPLIADFDDVFSGEAIEPLVLLFVVVLGWTGSTASIGCSVMKSAPPLSWVATLT